MVFCHCGRVLNMANQAIIWKLTQEKESLGFFVYQIAKFEERNLWQIQKRSRNTLMDLGPGTDAPTIDDQNRVQNSEEN